MIVIDKAIQVMTRLLIATSSSQILKKHENILKLEKDS